ncbi:MAG: hypothetical protein ACR2N0_15390, partial [Rubrobacteraceae bacterium]
VIHQQGLLQATVLGVGTGLLAGFIVANFNQINPDYLAFAAIFGFGISAVSLVVLQFGFNGPVTHHMILPAGVAAVAVLSGGGGDVAAVLAAVVAGVAGALLGELFSRLFLIHGDTHVDPPAFAIFVMTTIIILLRVAFGAV